MQPPDRTKPDPVDTPSVHAAVKSGTGVVAFVNHSRPSAAIIETAVDDLIDCIPAYSAPTPNLQPEGGMAADVMNLPQATPALPARPLIGTACLLATQLVGNQLTVGTGSSIHQLNRIHRDYPR